MASKIDPDDIQKVREAIPIEQIVGDYVTLQRGGVNSMKGLCPFHDEKTPSFHVTLGANLWHCFGCGEGGDLIDFVQRIEGLAFLETIEFLANKAGIVLHYVEGGEAGSTRVEPGTRQRLLECNRVAQDFFTAQLLSPEAQGARDFVEGRAFTSEDAARFGMGYAPKGWANLLGHLRDSGFTDAEITTVGLAKMGSRGLYDVFRDRVTWPIRDTTGAVLGFGARRLDDSDPENPKYINTPESPIYHKSSVLYGLDLARKTIGEQRRCVIVEGYTDVMAAHLSGVTCAVATCGTAFTGEHARIVRRLIGRPADGASSLRMPDGSAPRGGEVIFTFDGDAAGQKAALKAFRTDQDFAAQSFVAVAGEGLDPCDLRMRRGPGAVRDLVDSRRPLFEFVLKTIIGGFDLDNSEGRVAALRAAAPIAAEIRDRALRQEYVSRLAGWLGVNSREAWETVNAAGQWLRSRSQEARGAGLSRGSGGSNGYGGGSVGGGFMSREGNPGGTGNAPALLPVMPPVRLDPGVDTDPVWRLERDALVAALHFPALTGETHFDLLSPQGFTQPTLRAIFEVILAAGGVAEYARLQTEAAASGTSDPPRAALNRWAAAVKSQAGSALGGVVTDLATRPVPVRSEDEAAPWIHEVMDALERLYLNREMAGLRAKLNRLDAGEEKNAVFAQLMELETQVRALSPEY
ncbi:DNA primase [Mobiluncus mulieris]|uniref:DNA primase n=1 Tax=Mobiluncus mulieris TaxID=2052 RepID=UPI00146FE42D|nr:DNA primase [Mobiluncus mulieris]NMX11532.1 DNA primase [Mobiluncus mulieris]